MDFERNVSFGIEEYVSLVRNIADGYFDNSGDYAPYWGKLNVLRLYYNLCVTDKKFAIPHNITNAADLEPLLADSEFIKQFCVDLVPLAPFGFSFADAYADAMKIVEDRRSSVGRILDFLKDSVKSLTASLDSILTEENMEKLTRLSDSLDHGSLIDTSNA